jgi:hypothetical protein
VGRPRYPALYQLNTRASLSELGERLGRPATLDDVPDATLDKIAARGFDWVWPLGVWQTGEAGRQVSLSQPEWQHEYRELLPEFTPEDVCGSPFAIREYVVHTDFGGPEALARFRRRLAERGVRLMLDFVPNHTALDNPWVREHREYYVAGSEEDLAREPRNYCRVGCVLAHGRDPYFPGWPDTLQLNYRHAGLRSAMIAVLSRIARQCDGVRCDMAMLVLPDVIARTWGERAAPSDGTRAVDERFWPEAIEAVRRGSPEFVFMAEAYWDLEWTLQQQGFDYTYDKRLYDRLRSHDAAAVRGHLRADLEYQRRSARFLENHDEPRAAAVFPPPIEQAAAVIAFLVPGLRFMHEGQHSGRRVRTSNHLRRRVPEPVDREIETFYERLYACMRRPEVRDGEWSLLDPLPAWDGNPAADRFVASTWRGATGQLVVAVNYSNTRAQCYLRLPFVGGACLLRDLVNPGIEYLRDGAELASRGLYLDVGPWEHHVFELMAR